MKIWDIDQVCQNKQNVIILCWVKFLISNLDDKDDIKEGLLKRLKNIEKKIKKSVIMTRIKKLMMKVN